MVADVAGVGVELGVLLEGGLESVVELAYDAVELVGQEAALLVDEGDLGGVGIVRLEAGELLAPLSSPGVVVVDGFEKVVEADEEVEELAVAGAAGEGADEAGEGVVGVIGGGGGVAFFVEELGDLVFEEVGVVGVEDLEGGVEAYVVEEFAEGSAAEGVDGGDAGLVDEGELALESAVAGALVGFLGQGQGDTAFHFGGGGFGEGQDQDFADVGGLGCVGQEVGAAGGQHGGLAGAGSGGQQDVALGNVDGVMLFRGPVHRIVRSQELGESLLWVWRTWSRVSGAKRR